MTRRFTQRECHPAVTTSPTGLPSALRAGSVDVDPNGRHLKLRFDEFPALLDEGGSVVVEVGLGYRLGAGPGERILVVRTGEEDAIALRATCALLDCTCGQAAGEAGVEAASSLAPAPALAARAVSDGIVVAAVSSGSSESDVSTRSRA
jgi:hypothetical protein